VSAPPVEVSCRFVVTDVWASQPIPAAAYRGDHWVMGDLWFEALVAELKDQVSEWPASLGEPTPDVRLFGLAVHVYRGDLCPMIVPGPW
jgi:hypothetical protein